MEAAMATTVPTTTHKTLEPGWTPRGWPPGFPFPPSDGWQWQGPNTPKPTDWPEGYPWPLIRPTYSTVAAPVSDSGPDFALIAGSVTASFIGLALISIAMYLLYRRDDDIKTIFNFKSWKWRNRRPKSSTTPTFSSFLRTPPESSANSVTVAVYDSQEASQALMLTPKSLISGQGSSNPSTCVRYYDQLAVEMPLPNYYEANQQQQPAFLISNTDTPIPHHAN
ncbi:UNVERIFIED_CONTAM: hypothetical protein HDU68_004317 [Siphonaria sp. JEL0065]|nr:hypothetical protein HDU68_004317 [Siphonaria sp. JEL0065]